MSGNQESAVHETVDRLKEQLATAIAATSDAYRQTSRLIRVLAVLGQPSSPAKLVEETLVVLSQIYAADVTATARAAAGRLRVTATCGLPEDDPAYTTGWPLAGGAELALTTGRAVTRTGTSLDATDVPAGLADLAPRSAVWVPIGEAGAADELLIMYRISESGFPETDLTVLSSVAARLRLAVEARRRTAAAEALATFGHRLSSRLDPASLFDEAVRLLPTLVDAEHAEIVSIAGRTGQVRATTRPPEPVAGGEPAPVAGLPGWDTVRSGEAHTGDHGAGSLLAVPIIRDGHPAAILYAFRQDRRPFQPDAVGSATLFANYVGVALTNAELYLALGRSENSLRLITDSISDLIAVVDADGRFVYASPSHDRELGLAAGSLLGTAVIELVHPDDRAGVAATIAGLAEPSTIEYRVLTGRNTWVWVETALRPVPADGTLVLSSRVVDDRRRLEDELRRRATHDPLTKLANRDLTAERLEATLARTGTGLVGLLFCDLDKFKHVNDEFGHEAGDELLLQVADRLRACVRPADLLARFGGDEFVILLDGITGPDEATEIGHRVVRAIETPFSLSAGRAEISVSVGATVGRRGQARATAMLRDADAAMYAAKKAGHGRVELHHDAAGGISPPGAAESSHREVGRTAASTPSARSSPSLR